MELSLPHRTAFCSDTNPHSYISSCTDPDASSGETYVQILNASRACLLARSSLAMSCSAEASGYASLLEPAASSTDPGRGSQAGIFTS